MDQRVHTYVPPDMPLLRAELELLKNREEDRGMYIYIYIFIYIYITSPVRQNTRLGMTGFYCGLSR